MSNVHANLQQEFRLIKKIVNKTQRNYVDSVAVAKRHGRSLLG